MALLLENEEQEITKYREETLYIHEISLISNIITLRIYSRIALTSNSDITYPSFLTVVLKSTRPSFLIKRAARFLKGVLSIVRMLHVLLVRRCSSALNLQSSLVIIVLTFWVSIWQMLL